MTSEPVQTSPVSREELAFQYLDLLPYAPYPVQEEALFAWFGSEEGVLVCAPTGTGKTLIAEAAAFEALRNGTTIYYTTPLIALTDQKFLEIQAAAVRWGFRPEDVGLVTGHRRINPEAKVLVVVAEILLNRLLQPESFNFDNVSAVVMDEFHSFADMERGIVWEFTLSLLPRHVRLLLLSATVGNAVDFLSWLRNRDKRRLELVQGTERKVPLLFQWVGDKLLNEHLEEIARGDAETRRTPTLLFCFSRDECWSIAEELKGKDMLAEGQQKQLVAKLNLWDFTKGAGPKLKQILMRGVGVHHAGLLPRYRRIVEDLFQQKLLSVCVCTETLAAGINLPARSVVLPTLMKGPPGKKKIIDASSAHQIFGRAGRPQFDSQGFIYVLADEDDVRILRWKEKYDQIPEDTKDPMLIRAKKAMKKKMPTRSPNRQYWNEAQFEKLKIAPPRDLASQAPLPWRMLAYMLQISPEVELVRQLVRRRLMEPKQLEQGEQQLHRMLLTLHAAGVVRLEPEPPAASVTREGAVKEAGPAMPAAAAEQPQPKPKQSAFAKLIIEALKQQHEITGTGAVPVEEPSDKVPDYRPEMAYPTPKMADFFVFRSVNPVYALFLIEKLGQADPVERLQALESVLELPRSLLRAVRVPNPDRMPPGTLAVNHVDTEIIRRGLLPPGDLYPPWDPDIPFEERKYAPPLGDKLRMLFDSEYPNVHGVFVQSVWAAGDLLDFSCDFHRYISGRDLAKQEGLIFRHILKLILLLGEFSQVAPPGVDANVWRSELRELADRFTECCRQVDPGSTEQMLAHTADVDVVAKEPTEAVILAEVPSSIKELHASLKEVAAVEGHLSAEVPLEASSDAPELEDDFGGGLVDSD
ncbi:MAG: ski2-like helicase [Planctomycetaceae bacterium]|nr:ski2-like helicase [Planctomycetaceae bacterium]